MAQQFYLSKGLDVAVQFRMHVIHVPAHDVIIHLLYISRGKATKIVVDIKVYVCHFKTRRTIILTNDGECIT